MVNAEARSEALKVFHPFVGPQLSKVIYFDEEHDTLYFERESAMQTFFTETRPLERRRYCERIKYVAFSSSCVGRPIIRAFSRMTARKVYLQWCCGNKASLKAACLRVPFGEKTLISRSILMSMGPAKAIYLFPNLPLKSVDAPHWLSLVGVHCGPSIVSPDQFSPPCAGAKRSSDI
jgi:hypothetical protein